MSRQEDFHEQAEKYANECGGTTQEKCAAMTDYSTGCEHGYQYAVEKACEWLETHLLHAEADGYMTTDLFKQFKQAMEQ